MPLKFAEDRAGVSQEVGMTDREPHAPHLTPPAGWPAVAPAPPDAPHPETAHEGSAPLMTATLATRPPPRTPTAAAPGDRGRAWLDSLFAGELPPPAAPATALPPADRTAAEYDAVSRAAACRDLFVIHADAPAGERAIADLARCVAERVLVLTPGAAAADRIAERLLRCGVPALRALADDENPARPSSAVSRATSCALGGAAVEQASRDAAAAVADAEERVAAFATVSKAVARLNEVNDLLRQLDAEVAELTARRDRLEADLKAERDTPFAAALAAIQAEHDAASAALAAELQSAAAARAEKEGALAQARHHHAEAVRKPGLLARIFAKPKSGAPDAAELEKQVHAMEAEVAEASARAAELQARRDAAAADFATEREKRTAAELALRRGVVEAAAAAAESSRERARAEAAALASAISAAVPGDDHGAAERQLADARRRAAEVAAGAPEVAARALAAHRVVVAVPAALEADPVFTAIAADPPFGLLVLDRAEELPESEFPRLARLAERWVLVGDAAPPDEPRWHAGRHHRGRADAPFVARLARWLDRDSWAAEGARLVCRLAALSPEQRLELTREPLADRPEVELRFADSDGDRTLAEIAFPADAGVAAAKRLLVESLGAVLLRPCGELTWRHDADAITAAWPAADAGCGEWVELEPGVREKVAGCGAFAYTAAVSFDPAAGWDAERAAAWLADRLPPATGRFAALPRAAGPRG
jgi:hypothetical protein